MAGSAPFGLCWSTFFFGFLSLVGIIGNAIALGFHAGLLSLELISALFFVYSIHCICVGGCWVYAWVYPILIPIAITLSVIFFVAAMKIADEEKRKNPPPLPTNPPAN